VAVLKPRERLVYFRISEDEFRQFTSVCEEAGARSVSDLARNAVQRLIADGQRRRHEDEMGEKIRVLERLISAVTEQLQALATNPVREGLAPGLTPSSDGYHPRTQPVDQNGRKEQ
jgi:hypothetical protein